MKIIATLFIATFFSLAVWAKSDVVPEPVKQLEKQGIQLIKPFPAPGGVQGWLGQYQGMGVTIYLTPDQQHVISGYMYDSQGNNLSEKIIQEEITIPAGREMWQRLQKADRIREGNPDARRKIVVFADPFCPYCKQFWHKMQPALKAGKIELQTLLVGVITPDSGRYAAAILSAKDPAKAWYDYELSDGKTVPPFPDITSKRIWQQIQYNQRLMDELGANVTPAIYYMNADNVLQQVVGLPDEEQMSQMLGQGEKP